MRGLIVWGSAIVVLIAFFIGMGGLHSRKALVYLMVAAVAGGLIAIYLTRGGRQ